ncbi:MAG: molybdenum cofactor guanylyltransferase [Candidatus Limnocylindrales bacterium]
MSEPRETALPVPVASGQLTGVTGIVLAGGRASRFGADKLRATLDGRPILHLALDAVARIAPEVIVVVAPGATPHLPDLAASHLRVVHDPEPFGGPLVGLVAALATVRTPVALVAGGDMPRLVPAVLARLLAALDPEAGSALARPHAAILEVAGRVQPLPMALVVAPALDTAQSLLARDRRSLRELLGSLDAALVPVADWMALDPSGVTLVDIDRPADLET